MTIVFLARSQARNFARSFSFHGYHSFTTLRFLNSKPPKAFEGHSRDEKKFHIEAHLV
jgi:hypothetical protein